MATPVRVGLAFSYSYSYYREVVRGIRVHAETHPNWVFGLVIPDKQPYQKLGESRPDGLIGGINTESAAQALASWRCPIVNVSAVLPDLPFPRVGVDNHAVGRLAAEHFLERGLRHFGFAGHRSWLFSVEREAGFRKVVEKAGHEVLVHHDAAAQPFDPLGQHGPLHRRVAEWIERLPKPVGVLLPNDLWGLQLSEVCRQVGLRVPEDVALLGVDNDDLLCELARPPLSSIQIPGQQIGQQAAALLDRLLRGKKAPRVPVLIPPQGIVVRRSSDVLAIDDAEVVAAVRFIQSHAHEPIHVGDVLQQLSLSRRDLERRFRAATGRSVLGQIQRAHLERAKRLLVETDLPIAEVASQSGFTDFRHLGVVFRRRLELTPSAYRDQLRGVAAKR